MEKSILTVTDGACEKIKSLREARGLGDHAIRIKIHDLSGRKYSLQFVDSSDKGDEDTVVEAGGVVFYLDSLTLPKAEGATLDYVEGLQGSGFKLDNPNRPVLSGNPLAARVQAAIDERVNPTLAQHGGDVTLLDVSEGRVFLEFGGGCQGCGMVDVTLKQGIAKMLQEEIPEIREVLDTTDHAAGTNPYFQPEH
jgi:Fe/S biogenesis protein NfuA